MINQPSYTLGSTYLFDTGQIMKDGQPWDLSLGNGTATLILKDPGGREYSYPSDSPPTTSAQATVTLPLTLDLTGLVVPIPNTWTRTWRFVEGPITEYLPPVQMLVLSAFIPVVSGSGVGTVRIVSSGVP
jgi:hypothetical protein